MYVYWFFFRNSHQLHICQFSFAHNYTADEYRTTGTMIRVDGQKNVLEETLNKTIPINQACKWLPSQFRAKRKDFLFESVREEVFMNFNVVILNKTRVVYKNIYCRFSVIDLQLLYSSLGKNECNKWYLSKECWFVIFSLVVDWAFLFSCLNTLFHNFIILHHLLCFIWIISCQKL